MTRKPGSVKGTSLAAPGIFRLPVSALAMFSSSWQEVDERDIHP
jgi:hypothetical protein